jgi:hypothetical protein
MKFPPLPKKQQFTLCGEKYFLIDRKEFIFGLNKEKGVIVYKTETLYIISFFEQGITPGQCAHNTGRVYDYLSLKILKIHIS